MLFDLQEYYTNITLKSTDRYVTKVEEELYCNLTIQWV